MPSTPIADVRGPSRSSTRGAFSVYRGRAALLAVMLAATAATARAELLTTLYDSTVNGTGVGGSIAARGPTGLSFATGASAFSLEQLKFVLSSPGGVGTVSVQLFDATTNTTGYSPDPGYNAAAGVPNQSGPTVALGSIAASAVNAAFPSGFGMITLNSFSPVTLAANAEYWIVLRTTDGSDMQWRYNSDDTGTGVAGQNYLEYATQVFGTVDGPWSMIVQGQPLASPVPEISQAGLAGVAALLACGFGLVERRRRQPAG